VSVIGIGACHHPKKCRKALRREIYTVFSFVLVTKWKDQVWFEEYVTVKNNYTLNGFNYTLLRLYDWGYTPGLETHGAAKAAKIFHKGQDSVKKLLKKYDIGGFTSYDLSHLKMKQDPHVVVPCHAVHIYQM
jgi:heparosan-N-sulfate-glucuronate 5-epimerase